MYTQSSAPDGTESGENLGSPEPDEPDFDRDNRRSVEDRRTEDRRRSAKGLFEMRARRERIAADRRQRQRRSASRFRLLFWRRSGA
jgi:hypothetical protein